MASMGSIPEASRHALNTLKDVITNRSILSQLLAAPSWAMEQECRDALRDLNNHYNNDRPKNSSKRKRGRGAGGRKVRGSSLSAGESEAEDQDSDTDGHRKRQMLDTASPTRTSWDKFLRLTEKQVNGRVKYALDVFAKCREAAEEAMKKCNQSDEIDVGEAFMGTGQYPVELESDKTLGPHESWMHGAIAHVKGNTIQDSVFGLYKMTSRAEETSELFLTRQLFLYLMWRDFAHILCDDLPERKLGRKAAKELKQSVKSLALVDKVGDKENVVLSTVELWASRGIRLARFCKDFGTGSLVMFADLLCSESFLDGGMTIHGTVYGKVREHFAGIAKLSENDKIDELDGTGDQVRDYLRDLFEDKLMAYVEKRKLNLIDSEEEEGSDGGDGGEEENREK